MTPEQINVAIAEWCGWKIHPEECSDWKSASAWCESPGGSIMIVVGTEFPRYHSDLNAIHEAEEWLEKNHANQCQNYVDRVKRSISTGPVGRFRLIHATAPQRCEALLRTIGKWVEP